ATDHSLTVEGAAMFSHALSTHRADNDIDFYTAVDDLQREDPTVEEEDRAGSGMMGTLEFTSAVYYRYLGLNLGLLVNDSHIAALKEHHEQLKSTWGIKPALEAAIPDKPLDKFCAEILRHV